MRGDPVVLITCDGKSCGGDEFEALLTPLAGNCFDMRAVDGQLKRAGWSNENGKDYCADCTEDRV